MTYFSSLFALVCLVYLSAWSEAMFENVTEKFTELVEPPTWDIMEQGALHLHVASLNFSVNSEFVNDTAAYWHTRVYCYSNSSDYYDESTCGIPGPTIILHPNNQVQQVYLHNH